MKKSGYSPRSHGRGGKNPRRSQDRTQKPGGNSQNRSNARSRNAQASQLWISASSQTLTSHIQMVGKRKQDNASRKTSTRNGRGKSYGKDQGTFKPGKEKFRKNNASVQSSRPAERPPHRGKAPDTSQPQSNERGPQKVLNNIAPFELFCAYHLGIGKNNEYHPSNINEVANRFGVNPAVIRQVSKEYEMDSASLLDRDFDMALAQLDIQVAPEGVNRTELAKNIYEEFLNAPIVKRDWKKILEEDRKENQKIFGSR
ncbi:MAG: hypothetical protein V3U37_02675 [Nitrospinaceae bacterium]